MEIFRNQGGHTLLLGGMDSRFRGNDIKGRRERQSGSDEFDLYVLLVFSYFDLLSLQLL